MKGTKWYVGWNDPGCLPSTKPMDFDSWYEARNYLRSMMGEHFVDSVGGPMVTEKDRPAMGEYVEASAIIRAAQKDYPLALVYEGQVWWLADLPA